MGGVEDIGELELLLYLVWGRGKLVVAIELLCIIRYSLKPDKALFFLNDYLGKHDVQFDFDSKVIKISVPKVKQEDELTQQTEAKFSNLEIIGKDKEEGFLNIAVDIKNLLSLAMGRRVTFDKQEYTYSGKPKVTHKKMSKNSNFGYQIVPDYLISQYLKQTLPTWSKFTKP